jgi:threonine/homoserine/homoserine lactone efflux protein
MLILLLLFLLPAEVLTAVAALLDFFKTCIFTYLLYVGYATLVLVDRHTNTPINNAPSLCPMYC